MLPEQQKCQLVKEHLNELDELRLKEDKITNDFDMSRNRFTGAFAS